MSEVGLESLVPPLEPDVMPSGHELRAHKGAPFRSSKTHKMLVEGGVGMNNTWSHVAFTSQF